MLRRLGGFALAIAGAIAVGGIALQRDEPINALWLVTAAVCVYLLGYRFYAKWIETRVLVVDAGRATPAERLNNGRDFLPTHRWVVFGHHFAAIAGAGPLVGPTLAMQLGYLPGTLWILVGAVLGGCVQDMVILFLSTRRDGRSLGRIARDERVADCPDPDGIDQHHGAEAHGEAPHPGQGGGHRDRIFRVTAQRDRCGSRQQEHDAPASTVGHRRGHALGSSLLRTVGRAASVPLATGAVSRRAA